MNHRRIIKGNNTTIPTCSDLLCAYETNAVTEKGIPGKGNIPLSSEECVIESREFMIENKK